MKFKIGRVEIVRDNLQVDVYYDEDMEDRESFGFPVEYAQNNKYLDEIKRILKKREKAKEVNVDLSVVNQEFETD